MQRQLEEAILTCIASTPVQAVRKAEKYSRQFSKRGRLQHPLARLRLWSEAICHEPEFLRLRTYWVEPRMHAQLTTAYLRA
jgi:hypothetical protein